MRENMPTFRCSLNMKRIISKSESSDPFQLHRCWISILDLSVNRRIEKGKEEIGANPASVIQTLKEETESPFS